MLNCNIHKEEVRSESTKRLKKSINHFLSGALNQQKSQDGDRFENGYRFSDHPIPTHMYILYRVK